MGLIVNTVYILSPMELGLSLNRNTYGRYKIWNQNSYLTGPAYEFWSEHDIFHPKMIGYNKTTCKGNEPDWYCENYAYFPSANLTRGTVSNGYFGAIYNQLETSYEAPEPVFISSGWGGILPAFSF